MNAPSRMLTQGLALLGVLSCAVPVLAGGPFVVNGNGEPLRWDTSVPVPYQVDLGGLGQLSHDEAAGLVEASFGVWEAVPTASIAFARGGDLPCDLTPATLDDCGPGQLSLLGNGTDGISPVVFDTDGTLIDSIFGSNASRSIIGTAAVVGGTFLPPVITEAEAIINGKFFDGVDTATNPEIADVDDFRAVFVHEFGHWSNLDHSQINLQFAADGDVTNDAFVPTMFPTGLDDNAELLTLYPDDVAALSRLYPGPGFSSTSRLQGRLLLPDGVTPVQGGNLVLRQLGNPLAVAYSMVSGALYFPDPPPDVTQAEFGGPPPADLIGSFDLSGITPGTYTLEVEEIDPFFTGGSAVGPLAIPVFVPGPDEFWNGGAESADPGVDDPAESVPLSLTAGQVRSGVDIVLNDLPAPALLYAVDDEPLSDPNSPGTIVEIDLSEGRVLHRIATPEVNFGAPPSQGLAFAPPRGTLFYSDEFGTGLIWEVDPFTGAVVNSFPPPQGVFGFDGLAFLAGPTQPAGGVLYGLDDFDDSVLALDPDDGALIPSLSSQFPVNLIGALGGSWDDYFVTTDGGFILRVRPTAAEPLINAFPQPDLEFIAGLGFDGESVYAISLAFPEFRIWRLAPEPPTDLGTPTTRLDVLAAVADPSAVASGFSACDVALRGDIDGSMRVDGFDLAVLGRGFGTGTGDPDFRPPADLDRDADIDGTDLAILAAFFGRDLAGLVP